MSTTLESSSLELEGPLLGLRQFLTTERSFKMMKNTFYFMLKALFALEIFKFFSWPFDFVEKRLDAMARVNFKIRIITDWTANNCNKHIAQYLKK